MIDRRRTVISWRASPGLSLLVLVAAALCFMSLCQAARAQKVEVSAPAYSKDQSPMLVRAFVLTVLH